MNVSFFLKPKAEVVYVYNTDPVRTALDRMFESGFTAIPVLSAKGRYVGTITEPEQAGNMLLSEVTRRIHHRSVTIDTRIEDLVELVAGQNFVPVTDGRGMLCGIVTRRDVICQLSERCKALEILKDEKSW